MESKLSLQEQFNLPLVQDLIDENNILTASLSTKLPDSKIDDIKVPHTFKNKLLMAEGTHNGVFYPKDEILAAVEAANGVSLELDHKDTDGEGALNWVGKVTNALWTVGAQGEGMYGDLVVVDKPTAQKLAAGAKLGVSPTIDYETGELEDGTPSASELSWKSFSLVISPAIRATMLNSKIKKGDKMVEANAHQDPKGGAKTLSYKYPNGKLEKKEEQVQMSEIQVSEQAKSLLEERDVTIKEQAAELQKYRDTEKNDLVANLAANEFLTGRIDSAELEARGKSLLEKTSEILAEVQEVVGSHAELQSFRQFVKDFLKKNPGKTLKDAAAAWNKIKGTANNNKETGKMAEATLAEASLTNGEGTDTNRSISELASGDGPLQIDKDLYNVFIKEVPGGVRLE